MSLAMMASAFTGNNQTGSTRLFGVSQSGRYTRVRGSTLTSAGMSGNISSATVYESSVADAHFILFGFPFFTLPDFDGPFLQLTNRRNAGSELDMDRLSDFNFNNVTRNILLVTANKGPEVRLSFRDLFLQKWKDEIDPLLGGDANRIGDPVLTWTMFPNGISYLDANRKYLKIHQKLNINVPWWPDYEATITYHIYLYLTGAGQLRGHVARWAYWVEGGVKSGKIADKLEPKVIAGMDVLNSRLTAELQPFSGFAFEDLFYLPGNQTTRKATGAFSNWTTSDVTIVVQL